MNTSLRKITMLAIGPLLLASGKIALAQGTPSRDTTQENDSVRKVIMKQIYEAIQKSKQMRSQSAPVQMTPATITIDTKSDTATITLENVNDDSVKVALSLQYPPLVGSSSAADATPDSAWSMVSWITGLPRELTLAGHEKRHLTVHVKPPQARKAGEYSAHVVVAAKSIIHGPVAENLPVGLPIAEPSAIKLVYHTP